MAKIRCREFSAARKNRKLRKKACELEVADLIATFGQDEPRLNDDESGDENSEAEFWNELESFGKSGKLHFIPSEPERHLKGTSSRMYRGIVKPTRLQRCDCTIARPVGMAKCTVLGCFVFGCSGC